jgi:hypothetical protein
MAELRKGSPSIELNSFCASVSLAAGLCGATDRKRSMQSRSAGQIIAIFPVVFVAQTIVFAKQEGVHYLHSLERCKKVLLNVK